MVTAERAPRGSLENKGDGTKRLSHAYFVCQRACVPLYYSWLLRFYYAINLRAWTELRFRPFNFCMA